MARNRIQFQKGLAEAGFATLDGARGGVSIAELFRREGIAESLYYSWSTEIPEAGKRHLAGDYQRSQGYQALAGC